MGFRFDILTTDLLLYLLLVSIGIFIAYAIRNEQLRTSWRQVRRRPMAMAALVILLAYVSIGVLDSVHVRLKDTALSEQKGEAVFSPETLSLLDLLATPLRVQKEKTYSAPFAAHGYSRETIEHADGRRSRDYLRLKYGGKHLADPEDSGKDIALRSLKVLFYTLIILFVAATLIVLRISRATGSDYRPAMYMMLRGKADTPWRSILLAVLFVLFLLLFVIESWARCITSLALTRWVMMCCTSRSRVFVPACSSAP